METSLIYLLRGFRHAYHRNKQYHHAMPIYRLLQRVDIGKELRLITVSPSVIEILPKFLSKDKTISFLMSSSESSTLRVHLNCRKFTHYFYKTKEINDKIQKIILIVLVGINYYVVNVVFFSCQSCLINKSCLSRGCEADRRHFSSLSLSPFS